MADSKITALTAISTVDPTADPLVIVDVSDTSMAASGTTKKSTINQLLGAGGTATLASATITGDLTVDTSTLKVDSTNNRVGIGTASPTVPLYVTGNNATATAIMQDETNGAKLRLLANSINFDLSNSGGGGDIAVSGANPLTFRTNGTERARIDSSGNVGIGVTPSAWVAGAKAIQFGAYGSLAQSSSGNIELSFNSYNSGAGAYKYLQTDTASLYRASSVHSWFVAPSGTAGNAITFTQAMTLDASGNLALGQSSSALQSGGTGITIYGSTASELKFLNSTTGSSANDGTALVTSVNNFSINNRESGSVSIGTTNTQRMIVKTDGQVRFVPLAADPGGAEAGDVYYNSSSNKLKCYNGSTWNDLF